MMEGAFNRKYGVSEKLVNEFVLLGKERTKIKGIPKVVKCRNFFEFEMSFNRTFGGGTIEGFADPERCSAIRVKGEGYSVEIFDMNFKKYKIDMYNFREKRALGVKSISATDIRLVEPKFKNKLIISFDAEGDASLLMGLFQQALRQLPNYDSGAGSGDTSNSD